MYLNKRGDQTGASEECIVKAREFARGDRIIFMGSTCKPHRGAAVDAAAQTTYKQSARQHGSPVRPANGRRHLRAMLCPHVKSPHQLFLSGCVLHRTICIVHKHADSSNSSASRQETSQEILKKPCVPVQAPVKTYIEMASQQQRSIVRVTGRTSRKCLVLLKRTDGLFVVTTRNKAKAMAVSRTR